YVKNLNDTFEGKQDIRRTGFEFNGMRNHEYYFKSLEGGPKVLSQESNFTKALGQEFGSIDAWLAMFKSIALTRGVGWTMLYYDPVVKKLIHAWVDEQHLGQLNGCQLILGLDMWEHAFVYDYQPSGKKQYVDDFFANLNWEVIEENYKNASK
ncbi:MAG: Fe-Mn family superoxide dismutase, partial [Patescibacteria group bacterium]